MANVRLPVDQLCHVLNETNKTTPETSGGEGGGAGECEEGGCEVGLGSEGE